MLFQMRELPAHHSSDHIRHPVIVAHFLMLIPSGIFSRLGRPFPDLVSSLFTVCQQHSARRSGDDFISVKTDAIIFTKCSCLSSFVSCSHRLSRIFHDNCIVFFTHLLNLIHLTGCSIEVCNDHQFHFWIDLKCFLQRNWIHIPGITLRINKYRNTAFIHHRIDRCGKCHIGTEHSFPFQRAMSNLWLAIQIHSC